MHMHFVHQNRCDIRCIRDGLFRNNGVLSCRVIGFIMMLGVMRSGTISCMPSFPLTLIRAPLAQLFSLRSATTGGGGGGGGPGRVNQTKKKT